MTTAIYVLAAFAIGYLLGDRRGVKEANAILDENQRVLFAAMAEPPPLAADILEVQPRPTVH